MARSVPATLRKVPLPAPDADVYRALGPVTWPATLTDRRTGTPVSRDAWERQRDQALRAIAALRGTPFSTIDAPRDAALAQLTACFHVREEVATVDLCERLRTSGFSRYVLYADRVLAVVLQQALEDTLREGRLWTPVWESLFRRARGDARSTNESYPLSPSHLSAAWMGRLTQWLQTADKAQVESLLHSDAPLLRRTIVEQVPLARWSFADRWRLAAYHEYGYADVLWRNPSWTPTDRVAFVEDAMTRLRLGHELPDGASAAPRAAQRGLLFEVLRTAWDHTHDTPIPSPHWSTHWQALLASRALETLDGHAWMGRALFRSRETPPDVIQTAVAQWTGTAQEHPEDWVANPHTPVAYVRRHLLHPPHRPSRLFQQAARHPGVITDPELRARLLASRARAVWIALWPATPVAERPAYIAQFLKVAPLEALQVLVADADARAVITTEMVLPLFTRSDHAVREAAFAVIQHLQPGVRTAADVPKLTIVRRPPAPKRRP